MPTSVTDHSDLTIWRDVAAELHATLMTQCQHLLTIGATCTGDSYAWRSTPCRSEGALCLRRTPPDCVKVGSGSPETGPPNTRKRNASPGDAATPCTDTYVHPTKRICASPGPPSALASNSRLLHRPRGPRRNLLFTPQIPPTFLNQVLTKGSPKRLASQETPGTAWSLMIGRCWLPPRAARPSIFGPALATPDLRAALELDGVETVNARLLAAAEASTARCVIPDSGPSLSGTGAVTPCSRPEVGCPHRTRQLRQRRC
ncbi:hypothetical protein ACKKBG_A20860 [Auxenochlorella protothecoides x Auxenochlorella symbiontica]|uniref:Uncharacterized protein n=1 Tax=Auxenochlorella protothecoides TaxID=3075 RepID=A0A1D2A0J0_AUXPR